MYIYLINLTILVNNVLNVSTMLDQYYIFDNSICIMDYRVNLAARMLANKRGSLIGAVLAVSIGILVIHVNFVIFQGIYDAIIRDMTEYRFGDIFVSHEEESTIERSHVVYTNWFERVPLVQSGDAAAFGQCRYRI